MCGRYYWKIDKQKIDKQKIAERDPACLPIDLLPPYPAEDMNAFNARQNCRHIRNNSIDLLSIVRDTLTA
jgi:hypothetical protein